MILPQVASSVWVPAASAMPFASGPQPDDGQALELLGATDRARDPEPDRAAVDPQQVRAADRGDLGARGGSGVKCTPGSPISAIPTGIVIGCSEYQLMVLTWRTASTVNLIVLPESCRKRSGTLTTESMALRSGSAADEPGRHRRYSW